MPQIEENSKNLENELLKGLRNQTVIGDIQNQVVANSILLQNIKILDNPGDVLKIVGLKSNKPKQFSWDYKEKEFGPGDAVTHKAEITDKDKLIFYTVFSESIEKIAVGEKVHDTVAKQAAQVSHDIANFYTEEFTQKYASDLERYHENAIVRLNADQLRNMQLVGEIAITAGFQMTSPSTLFNKRKERCNISDVKKLLCLVDYSLYGRGKVASIYTSPSPVLKELAETFTLIPCNMSNNVKLALIDSSAIYLWSSLHQRYLKLDEYVASHKLLDHVWRKWIFVDYRPAFAIVYDKNVTTDPLSTGTLTPPKNLLTNYNDLSDTDNHMDKEQAKAWNKLGLSFEKVKEWLDAGFKINDYEFVGWMINTKAGSEEKFANYNDPSWILDGNLGKDGHKTLEELREESKAEE